MSFGMGVALPSMASHVWVMPGHARTPRKYGVMQAMKRAGTPGGAQQGGLW
jgi:hypothetical protein